MYGNKAIIFNRKVIRKILEQFECLDIALVSKKAINAIFGFQRSTFKVIQNQA